MGECFYFVFVFNRILTLDSFLVIILFVFDDYVRQGLYLELDSRISMVYIVEVWLKLVKELIRLIIHELLI